MSETPNLALPFVEAAQAQKHVTVNEGLTRLDALTQLRLMSLTETTPPTAAEDGEVYAIPFGALNEWAGKGGELAIRANGGWAYVTPATGWTGWVIDTAQPVVFDGTDWMQTGSGSGIISPSGATLGFDIIEIDHQLTAGPSSSTVGVIPEMSIVLGVTGRVAVDVTGTLTSWRLGVAGSDNRYGSGYGLVAQSWLRGITGTPVTYYSDTPLLLTADGGDFAGGDVRFAVHCLQLGLPNV